MPDQRASVFDPRFLRHATKLAFSMDDVTLDNVGGFLSESGKTIGRHVENARTGAVDLLERGISKAMGRDIGPRGDNATQHERNTADGDRLMREGRNIMIAQHRAAKVRKAMAAQKRALRDQAEVAEARRLSRRGYGEKALDYGNSLVDEVKRWNIPSPVDAAVGLAGRVTGRDMRPGHDGTTAAERAAQRRTSEINDRLIRARAAAGA
jgi:hypothetical protein